MCASALALYRSHEKRSGRNKFAARSSHRLRVLVRSITHNPQKIVATPDTEPYFFLFISFPLPPLTAWAIHANCLVVWRMQRAAGAVCQLVVQCSAQQDHRQTLHHRGGLIICNQLTMLSMACQHKHGYQNTTVSRGQISINIHAHDGR